ncbi:MAG TPA: hypothetical protein VGR28_12275 [Candidatus Thermoplasmatota archaeon]|jgi:hypothetical protein|nr:hypothetical protein [Candidatus Thermoplasmatota archaeon]
MRAAWLVLAVALAGCVSAPAPLPDAAQPTALAVPTPAELAALAAGLPCEAAQVAGPLSDNLREVSLLDLTPTPGRLGALDAHADLLLVEHYDAGGFDVVRIADPRAPRVLGSFESPPITLDLEFTTDGATALLGEQSRVRLVDVRDPTRPVEEGVWDFPTPDIQAHTLHVFPWQGRDLVFTSSQTAQGMWIFAVDGAPGARNLSVLSVYKPPVEDTMSPHEAWATFDEDLQAPVLYVANGWAGWYALDITDPAHPRQLGLGLVPNLDPYQEYVHSIIAAKVGGKRLVATTAEIGANALKVYDATDFAAPRLLATWTSRPVPTPSEHFFTIVGSKLLLAHYQEGGFIFDLASLPAAPLLPWGPVARFQPGPDVGPTSSFPFQGWEGIYDVLVKDGLTYWTDRRLGVHVLAFGCFEPGDTALTTDA